jgi:hypothetical protein
VTRGMGVSPVLAMSPKNLFQVAGGTEAVLYVESSTSSDGMSETPMPRLDTTAGSLTRR